MSKSSVQWPIEQADPESVGLCPERLGRIGEVMRRWVDEGRTAGVITVVARRGKIAHLECTGFLNLEKKLPMREDAIFRIYSMTKLVTTVAVLMLLEEGRFLLKESVKKWLPEFENLRVGVTGADGKQELVRLRRDITIHDLLTHMAGLTYDTYHEAREKGWTLQQFITECTKRPLRRQPGLLWDYSEACDVLGRLIEVVSGQGFDQFLKERIFGPLGMTDTEFWVPPEKADRLAQCYTEGDVGKLVPATDFGITKFLERPAMFAGGAGLVSTTSDFLRFSLALVNGGALGRVRLLGRKTVELMASDHLPPGHAPIDVNDRMFGLGVSVVRRLGETRQIASVGEFGWGGAACTQVWIDPSEQMVTMLMLQHRPKDKYPLMDMFKQAAYQAIVD